jgi:archaellum component FlaC
MEQLSEQPALDTSKMEELLEDLLDQLGKLDLSIDYLAAAVTGDDPLNIGVAQSALGRLSQAPKKNNKMQETKSKLKDIIEEVISEQDTPEAVKKAVESDESMEELLSAMAERMSQLENELQRMKSEYSEASARFSQVVGQKK